MCVCVCGCIYECIAVFSRPNAATTDLQVHAKVCVGGATTICLRAYTAIGSATPKVEKCGTLTGSRCDGLSM